MMDLGVALVLGDIGQVVCMVAVGAVPMVDMVVVNLAGMEDMLGPWGGLTEEIPPLVILVDMEEVGSAEVMTLEDMVDLVTVMGDMVVVVELVLRVVAMEAGTMPAWGVDMAEVGVEVLGVHFMGVEVVGMVVVQGLVDIILTEDRSLSREDLL